MLERTAPVIPRSESANRPTEDPTVLARAVEHRKTADPEIIFNEIVSRYPAPQRKTLITLKESLLRRAQENYAVLLEHDLAPAEADMRGYYLDTIHDLIAELPLTRISYPLQHYDEVPNPDRELPDWESLSTPAHNHDTDPDAETEAGSFDDSSARETKSD